MKTNRNVATRPTRAKGKTNAKRSRVTKKRKSKPLSPSRRQLIRAVDRLHKAAETLTLRADEIVHVIDDVTELARQREREDLIDKLHQADILDYLQQLALAFDAQSEQTLPGAMQQFRHAPAALLDFLREHWQLTTQHQPGQRLTLDDSDLPKVRFISTLERTPAIPVEVVVVASGWKLGRQQIAKPTVEVMEWT
ncbi:MAG: hypothetical protein IT445_13495 [Phycisphaeraceae bacterium]|nr:hypothetical protein [Phycisphaeraceae bacterium]